MADNESSLQENLISAGLNPTSPTSTYVDFATQLAKNRQDQAAAEQALKLAKEHVAQARYQTSNEQQAQAAGYNPILSDTMTPEEAVAYLKVISDAKGLEIDQAHIAAWAAQLPPRVNRQIVESFANRFARETLRFGQPAKFEKSDVIKLPQGIKAEELDLIADPKDATIGHVPEDGMYQVAVDNQGVLKKFVPGGKEPVDPTVKLHQHDEDINRKEWRALNDHIDGAFKTRSGGLGSLITSIYRADRAFNTLKAHGTLTAQDLANVSQDIAGIYQGGAPTVISAKDNSYETLFTHLADVVRRYTGVILSPGASVDETKQKLLQVISDLRDSSGKNFESWMNSQAAGYSAVIGSDPANWEKMKQSKLDAVYSGLLLDAQEKKDLNVTGAELATEPKDPNKSKEAKADEGASVKLPSADEIKAERARRKAEKK
jgi:hypothetical protein